HYYPFGLKHTNYNSDLLVHREYRGALAIKDPVTPEPLVPVLPYNYKYNGKELQDELGLNFYDFGFRNYDPAIGRWMNIDPLAEKRHELNPYNYVQNSPLFRFDPNGLTDFTLNKKTGEIKQIGEANDEPDRILKTNSKGEVRYNKKGEAKVAINDIEKNILKDGQNFKRDSNVFEVGGEGQPSRQGIEKFALELSNYVGTEIGGAYFSKDSQDKITHMTIGAYEKNSYTENKNNGHAAIRKISSSTEVFLSYQLRGKFHTHPNESTRFEPSKADIDSRNEGLKSNPNLLFYILTYPKYGNKFPYIIDYTKP
ncbi:RHS repeat-associated protein, partial [Flavobacterium sp. 28YEA47A]|uniref:RHS repeat domain-containing protein n=1 Tax=Flavobacterium sp. 28YEA47A TaxID=3156276 RepID=UPI003511B2DD